MALTFEWDNDIHGKSVLVARKSRGKISISELQDEISNDWRYAGHYAVIFKATEDSRYSGWGDEHVSAGDRLELYQLDDYTECPLCNTVMSIEHCAHCGENLKAPANNERKDNENG